MIQPKSDRIERAHREVIERHREQETRGHALVDPSHEKACNRPGEKAEHDTLTREEGSPNATDYTRRPPLPAAETPTVHYTQLQDLPADSPIRGEWPTYRRELPRLLQEGMEGKIALIKEEAIIGITGGNPTV